MRKNPNSFFYVLLPLIVGGLLVGVYRLLILRFEAGDVYPAYSSLRADPLGTKAFYDGLSGLKDVTVDRSYQPIEKLERPEEVALMDLGEDAPDVMKAPASLNREWEAFVLKGGRLVVGFLEQSAEPEKEKPTRTPTPERTPTPSLTASPTPTAPVPPAGLGHGKKWGKKAPKKKPEHPASRPTFSPTPTRIPEKTLGQKWGFSVAFKALPKSTVEDLGRDQRTYAGVTVVREGDAPVPPALFLHTGYYFDNLDPAWRALYRRDGKPVVIERRMGKGMLVFFLDSYLVSNEAMQDDRHADLLAYFVGEKSRVVFDETHLGVFEAPNTATLIKGYGLRGFLLGLLVLALFFIWRNSSSLVPPRPEPTGAETGAKSGKDFSSGLVNLLRRNIGPKEVLEVCFDQWKKTFARGRVHLASKTAEMERELEAVKRTKGLHPVEGYVRMSKILKKRK